MDPPDSDTSNPPPSSVETITDNTESVIDFLDDYFGRHNGYERSQLIGLLVIAVAIHSGVLLIAQHARAGLYEIVEALRRNEPRKSD